MFDDMCHLKPHSEKPDIRSQSHIAEEFASLSKCVDKFHFPGHKSTDTYCRNNSNPKVELAKLGIKELNSPVCEQAFNWINCFKNVKTMNESRFKLYMLVMIDLHNLNVEGKVSSLANPLSKTRIEATSEATSDAIVILTSKLSIKCDEKENTVKEKHMWDNRK